MAHTRTVGKHCTKTGTGATVGSVEDESERIGAAVRRLREGAGLTQAELAERLTKQGIGGIYPQTVTKIEAGQRGMKLTEGIAIARVLGVPVEWLARPEPVAEREGALKRAVADLQASRREVEGAVGKYLDAVRRVELQIKSSADEGVDDSRLAWARREVETPIGDVVVVGHARRALDLVVSGLYTAILREERLRESNGEHSEAP